MTRLKDIVVVGASLAGLRAVEALRRRAFDGKILWIGAEPHRPYDRPPLSKQLLQGAWEAERLFFRQRTGYEELDVDLQVGARAIGLDARARHVVLEDGRHVAYDGLVIATGASPRRLPGTPSLDGIHTLRTLDDALAIRAALQGGPRVVVVGAGFIGLEVAASCRRLGLEVTVVEQQSLPLAGVLGPAMGDAVARLHRAEGVDLRTGVSIGAFEGSGRVESVRLSDGARLPADLVVVGIGVRPETDWLQGSGVAVADGVTCDETCAASAPGVVAAGDVASWDNPLFGERMRVEHWSNAVEQAAAAIERLLAGPEAAAPFAPVPYFWSDQYDVKIQFAGRVGAGDELRIVEGSPEERKLVALYGRGGRLRGVLCWNRPGELVKYRKLIAERAPFGPPAS